MDAIKIGDIVTRKSHDHDVFFKMVRIRADGHVDLKGMALRLEADAPLVDLVKANPKRVESLAEARERLISARRQSRRLALTAWFRTHIIRKIPGHT